MAQQRSRPSERTGVTRFMVTTKGVCLLVVVGLMTTAAAPAAADEPARRPLPEALLTESTTDIDAEEAGELEVEARSGGAQATLTSLEVEWRIFKVLGMRIEPSYARIANGGSAPAIDVFGLNGSLAWVYGTTSCGVCTCKPRYRDEPTKARPRKCSSLAKRSFLRLRPARRRPARSLDRSRHGRCGGGGTVCPCPSAQ